MSVQGCSGAQALKLLTGGGPNVAANVQAGKTNIQSVGQTTVNAPKVTVRPKARVDTIDQSTKTSNNYDTSPLMLLLLIVGWLAPSPNEIVRKVSRLWQRDPR